MIFKNFFRKDLHLKSHWWHRLFLVVFVVCFIYSLYSVWNTPLPKYGMVESLQNRMTTELKLLPELITSKEKIGQYENNLYGDWYEKNEGWVLRQPDVYCSRNIAQHIEGVSAKTGIALYKGNGATELLSLADFKKYLTDQRANCVYATSIDDNTKVIGYAWFIDNDLRVWRESSFASALYILKGSLLITIPFLLLVVLYYKVFLFIVFGNNKKNSNPIA
jgi:hypothetical protein